MVPTMPRRLVALATVSALALATAAPAGATPPPMPQNGLQGAPPAPQAGTPPGRVGRLARLAGTVSHHTADAEQWSPAVLNFPVTTGDSFWTEPGARADIQVASSRLTLAPATELDVATLDDQALAASEPQGEVYLELRAIPAGDTYTIQTPRGAIQIAATGRYDVVAGDTTHPTLITVVEGAAQVTGSNLALQVGPHQTASISGTDTFQGSVGPISQGAFLTAMLAEDRPAPRASAPIPQIVAGMTGCEDLQTQGTWTETPQYGTVWYPPVESDWVPYREGRWSYVGQWGWTWVDQAPWGFAPFHYGRWARIDNRWGWVPVSPGGYAEPAGAYRTPVYAPALVGFIGVGAAVGAAIGFAAGSGAGGPVGWVPLGPREAYYPPYRTNLNYVRSINATSVQNVNQTITQTNIVNNRTVVVQNFFNRGAATVVPAAAMVQSAPIAAAARPLPAEQFSHVQAQFQAPVRPAAATVGVTPAVARQFNFTPNRPAQPLPGPVINPALLRAEAGRPLAVPALRAATPAGSGAVAPAEQARPEPTPRPAAPGPQPTRGTPNPAPVAGLGERPAMPVPEGRPGAPGPEIRPGTARELRPDGAAPEPRPGGPAASAPGIAAARQGAPGPEIRPGGTPEPRTPEVRTPELRPGTPVPEPRPGAPAAEARPATPGQELRPVPAAPAGRPPTPEVRPQPRPAPPPAPHAAPPVPRPESHPEPRREPNPAAFHPPAPPPRPPVVRVSAPPPRPAPRPAPPPPAGSQRSAPPLTRPR